ncbi:MAG: trigger factor [Spirochaetaceae bacterium]|nr:trigger factor [Spirochaetaceae bacterium]
MTMTVPVDEIHSVYDSMMKEYTKSVKMDGFRKGHVPAQVLERKFGESLRMDAMSRIVESAVEEGLKESEEKPLAYEPPTLEGEPEFALDKDFIFSVTYDVLPTIDLPSLEGIEISLPKVAVTDEDLGRELEAIRQRNAIVTDKNGPAEKGDVVTLNWTELDAEGKPVSGTAREDFTFELGSGKNLYKFDDDIIGMTPDSSKTFSKAYPADYEYQELAGKTVTISATVTKIKQKDVPALDDELAQDVSEKYKTLDDLKASIRSQLEEALSNKLRSFKENAVVNEALKRTTIEVPESMVSAELAMRWESLKREMGIESDEQMEKIAEYSGKSRQSLYEDWKPSAGHAISARLVLDKLIEAGSYIATDEELVAEYEKQSKEMGISADEVKAEYEKQNSVDYLKDQIKEKKFFDSVLSSVIVKDGEAKTFVDFMNGNE